MIQTRYLFRAVYAVVILLSIVLVLLLLLFLESKTRVFVASISQHNSDVIEPFPVSVNRFTETIIEDPGVDHFYQDTLALRRVENESWWGRIATTFSEQDWYQNLASPVSRIFVIWPGQRKEEVVKHIGDIMRWDKAARNSFTQLMDSSYPIMAEGKYLPGHYVAHRGATPDEIQGLIADTFATEVLARYTPEVAAQVPLQDALIIASLLEREASDFENMREISGVIWNRLFTDMPLQLDATLQYVRGSNPYESSWWPTPRPSDKYSKSPYNTYQNEGLPPAPIANPSTEAIVAALNPIITDCIFYFHARGNYHCSPTYQEHVAKLRSIYGRGS